MTTVPSGLFNHAQFASVVEEALGKLGPEVVRARYYLESDSTGDPAIYFNIVLSDEASAEKTLAQVTLHIKSVLSDEIRPLENWGLFYYFSFRSKSEQAKLRDPSWA